MVTYENGVLKVTLDKETLTKLHGDDGFFGMFAGSELLMMKPGEKIVFEQTDNLKNEFEVELKHDADRVFQHMVRETPPDKRVYTFTAQNVPGEHAAQFRVQRNHGQIWDFVVVVADKTPDWYEELKNLHSNPDEDPRLVSE